MSPSEYRLDVIRQIHQTLIDGKASKALIELVCETLEAADGLLVEADALYDPELDREGDHLAECFDALGELFE